jgi:hypothetical protein
METAGAVRQQPQSKIAGYETTVLRRTSNWRCVQGWGEWLLVGGWVEDVVVVVVVVV